MGTRVRGVGLDHLHEQEAAFEAAVVDALRSAIQQVLESGAVHKSAARLSIDDLNVLPSIWRPYADKLAAVVRDRFVEAANEQARHLADATGRLTAAASNAQQNPVPVFTSESSAALSHMDNARNRLVGVGDDLWANARQELTLGMQQGESIPNLAKRVQGAIDSTKGRATTIARTQIVSASNAGSIAYMRSTGEVAKKLWLATGDARTRPTHEAADGQEVGIDEQFDVGADSLDYPGDEGGSPEEVINCRCTMTYDLTAESEPVLPDEEPVIEETIPEEVVPEPEPEPVVVPTDIIERAKFNAQAGKAMDPIVRGTLENQLAHLERQYETQNAEYQKVLKEKTKDLDKMKADEATRKNILGWVDNFKPADTVAERDSLKAQLAGSPSAALISTAENPLAGYGARLVLSGDSKFVRDELADLEKHVPVAFHRLVSADMTRMPNGGMYIGGPKASDFAGLESKALGRIAADGRSMDTTSHYSPGNREMVVLEQAHGSVGVAVHEFSHAMDRAVYATFRKDGMGIWMSDSQQFTGKAHRLMDALGDKLRPYYRDKVHGGHGLGVQEMWAESMAVWMKNRGATTPIGVALQIVRTLGTDVGLKPAEKAAAKDAALALVNHFEELLSQVERLQAIDDQLAALPPA